MEGVIDALVPDDRAIQSNEIKSAGGVCMLKVRWEAE